MWFGCLYYQVSLSEVIQNFYISFLEVNLSSWIKKSIPGIIKQKEVE